MLIVGIDCASKPEKTGIVIGQYQSGKIQIEDVFLGKENESVVSSILSKLPLNKEDKVILAIDAPLGWTYAMKESLKNHTAGASLVHNSDEKDNFFRRFTDIFIHQKVGKLPLEVGADRIARAAYSALQIINEFREKYKVEMLWNTDIENLSGMGTIEVYPAATLKQYGFPDSGYKKKSDAEKRQIIIKNLEEFFSNIADFQSDLVENADKLDAVICLLCAKDFIDNDVFHPSKENLETVKQEGWIWVKNKKDCKKS